ncbi:MAG TPA: DUF308 domain-containing protein, partial [Beijerinckiaceae bacterium]|nr:DUF308 domain-containing protein [Beijerinckiaceae bacterium]
LRGVFGVLFGILAFASPGAVMITLALFFAAYLIVDGVAGIVAAVRAARANERWGLLLAEGALNIVMGVVAAALPVTAVFAFVIITAAWALISGGLMIAAAFKLHESHGRWWLAIGGVISVIWGVLLVLSPVIGAVVLTWWLGAYAFVFGVALIVLAFRLKARKDDTPGSAAARAA